MIVTAAPRYSRIVAEVWRPLTIEIDLLQAIGDEAPPPAVPDHDVLW